MKLKKIVAAVAAAAVAVSAMAVNAFALSTKDYVKDGTIYLVSEKAEEPNWTADAGVAVTDIYGATYHVTFDAAEVANESTWIGGGIGSNSNSTGWAQNEWGRNDKPIVADLENGTITWLSDKPIFAADDAYAQIWLQTWGGTVTVNSIDILGAGGTVIATGEEAAAPAEEATTEEETAAAPAEETAEEAPAEEAAPAEEEVVADEAPAEEAPAAEETVEEAPAADAEAATAPAATGNTTAAVIVSVMAVAAAAAVVAKKRK